MFGVARIRLGQKNRLGPKARDVFLLTFVCFGVEVAPAFNRLRGQSSPWFPQVVRVAPRLCLQVLLERDFKGVLIPDPPVIFSASHTPKISLNPEPIYAST